MAAPEFPELTIDDIKIRPARAGDAPALAGFSDDPDIRRSLPWVPCCAADAHRWAEAGTERSRRLVIDSATGELSGALVLDEHRPGTGELSCWVAAAARGRGVASRAVRAVSDWAAERNLPRLEMATELTNLAAQRLALAAGFTREGVRRSSRPGRDGTWQDEVVWSRLPGDPPGPGRPAMPDLPGGQLTDGELTLRCCRPEDADDVHRLFNLPDIQARLTVIRPRTPAEIMKRCALAAPRWLAGERADLVIRHAATGAFVGDTQLMPNAWLGQAELGFNLVPEWRGRGYAARSVRLVSDWALEALGVARVVAGTAPDNPAAQATLKRAGFHQEAVHVAKVPAPGGGRHDQVLYVRIAPELGGREEGSG